MNTSHPSANPGFKTGLVLVAVLAAAALVLALSVGSADAGTGGVVHDKSAKVNAKYQRLWAAVSKRNKRWAHSTAKCESGRDPKAIGGGGAYRGAFQFLKSTWKNSPRSPGGDPINYSYKTQAFVAVALKKRDGRGHWPVCG